MPRLSNKGTLIEILLLNAMLAVAAWRARLPGGFYLTSGFANLLIILSMKSFTWWLNRPGTLEAGRKLLLLFGCAWIVFGLIRIIFLKLPFL
jgi:hypothetical protein